MRGDPSLAFSQPRSRYWSHRLLSSLVSWLARPTTKGHIPQERDSVFFVLEHHSLADFALLATVVARTGNGSSGNSLARDQIFQRCVGLKRSIGWQRRSTMPKPPDLLSQLHEAICQQPELDVQLVPVSVFWGRAVVIEGSRIGPFFSENWGASRCLRRMTGLLFNRSDIFVHFTEAIRLRDLLDENQHSSLGIRRVARVLRARFTSERLSSLGPERARRSKFVPELVKSPNVRQAMATTGGTIQVNEKYALRSAKTIASRPSYLAIRVVRGTLAWFWSHVYTRIDAYGIEKLAQLSYTHTPVYVPVHRSHIDYIVLSYVLYCNGYMIPHIAAGDNLNTPLLGPILRRCGAFFIKRSFRDDPIYREVIATYLHRLIKDGHPIEFFLEGTRSRTGRTIGPRHGFVQMFLNVRASDIRRPPAFVPVYISYEKLVEGDGFLKELRGTPKQRERMTALLKAVRLIRHDFGEVTLCFGNPINLDSSMEDLRASNPGVPLSHSVSEYLAQAMNRCAFVNDVNILALAIRCLEDSQHIQIEDLLRQVQLVRELIHIDADSSCYGWSQRPAEAIVQRCKSLGYLTETAESKEGVLSLSPDSGTLLPWFAESVLHTIAVPASLAWVHDRALKFGNENEFERVAIRVLRMFALEYTIEFDPSAVKRYVKALYKQELLNAHESTTHTNRTSQAIRNLVESTIKRFYVDFRLAHNQEPKTNSEQASSVELEVERNQLMDCLGFSPFEYRYSRLAASLASAGNALEDNATLANQERIGKFLQTLSMLLGTRAVQDIEHVILAVRGDNIGDPKEHITG